MSAILKLRVQIMQVLAVMLILGEKSYPFEHHYDRGADKMIFDSF